jgi:hypothetical protein
MSSPYKSSSQQDGIASMSRYSKLTPLTKHKGSSNITDSRLCDTYRNKISTHISHNILYVHPYNDILEQARTSSNPQYDIRYIR